MLEQSSRKDSQTTPFPWISLYGCPQIYYVVGTTLNFWSFYFHPPLTQVLDYRHTTPHPFNIYLWCVCVCTHARTCIHVCHSVHEEIRGQFVGIYSLLYGDFRDWTQAIRLGGKYLYLLPSLSLCCWGLNAGFLYARQAFYWLSHVSRPSLTDWRQHCQLWPGSPPSPQSSYWFGNRMSTREGRAEEARDEDPGMGPRRAPFLQLISECSLYMHCEKSFTHTPSSVY